MSGVARPARKRAYREEKAMAYICYAVIVKRTTIFLPEDTHEQLRRDAFRARISMAELIRLRLRTPVGTGAKPHRASADPLLKVAGICRGEPLSENLDSELYG